ETLVGSTQRLDDPRQPAGYLRVLLGGLLAQQLRIHGLDLVGNRQRRLRQQGSGQHGAVRVPVRHNAQRHTAAAGRTATPYRVAQAAGVAQVRYTPGSLSPGTSSPLGTSSTSSMSAPSPGRMDEPVLDEMVSSLSLYGVVMRQRK